MFTLKLYENNYSEVKQNLLQGRKGGQKVSIVVRSKIPPGGIPLNF